MKNYESFYQQYREELEQKHLTYQRRIRSGIKVNLFLPLLFLFLSFSIGGSRFFFLILWIVSLFGIAAYLIGQEYLDFEVLAKLKEMEPLPEAEELPTLEQCLISEELPTLEQSLTAEKMPQREDLLLDAVDLEESDPGLITVDSIMSSKEEGTRRPYVRSV